MIQVNRFPDFPKAAKAAGIFLAQTLESYRTTPILLLFSGGSALDILDGVSGAHLSPECAVGILDERITPDAQDRNIEKLTGTEFFGTLGHPAVIFPRQDGHLTDIALAYESDIQTWLVNHPQHKIIITQGIGPDGHTAGIMPLVLKESVRDVVEMGPAGIVHTGDSKHDAMNAGAEKQYITYFDAPDRWVVGYDAGAQNPFPDRVTVTFPFLRTADVSVVYACGAKKKVALGRALESDGNLPATPARIIQEMSHVVLFTDQNVSM